MITTLLTQGRYFFNYAITPLVKIFEKVVVMTNRRFA